MLRVTGHEAAVLDGGIQAWPGGLSTGDESRPPASFTPRPWPPERLVDIDTVSGAPGVLIDARAANRYAGEPDGIDPRPGHIPGARSLPTREHNGPDGRLRDLEALRERFAAVGIGARTEVVSYCGSGVTACHNLLVLEHAGLGPGRLFPGSWSQWSRDPSRPAETS
jgi:thiosulfate/3-mercaptopyruvate sulfurtransferase